jgi:hypothetical protein
MALGTGKGGKSHVRAPKPALITSISSPIHRAAFARGSVPTFPAPASSPRAQQPPPRSPHHCHCCHCWTKTRLRSCLSHLLLVRAHPTNQAACTSSRGHTRALAAVQRYIDSGTEGDIVMLIALKYSAFNRNLLCCKFFTPIALPAAAVRPIALTPKKKPAVTPARPPSHHIAD